jgi:hypothetical protein
LIFISRKYFRTRNDSITFTVPRDSKKPLVWFDINGHTFFNIYKLEGVNPEDPNDDSIYFEVSSQYLITALSQMKKGATSVEIKLGKEEFPFFFINMRISSGIDRDKFINVSNKVPVIIIPRLGWDDFELPYCHDYEVEAQCPRYSIFKRFIDTFKCSHNIKLILRKDSTLTIEANSNVTRHFTIFNNIKILVYNSDPQEIYKDAPISIIVEQKKVSQWLHNLSFPTPFKLHCMIENNKTLKLFFRRGEDILAHFLIAAEYDDDATDDSENSNDEN